MDTVVYFMQGAVFPPGPSSIPPPHHIRSHRDLGILARITGVPAEGRGHEKSNQE